MSTSLQAVCPHCAAVNRLPAKRLGERPTCGRCHQPLFSGEPAAVDEAAFQRHVSRGDLPVLVDFWAAWCGPCRIMAPQFARAAALLEPEVRLLKVDTEAEQGLAGRLGIRSIPTLVLFHQGRERARQAGATSAEELVRWVRAQLG